MQSITFEACPAEIQKPIILQLQFSGNELKALSVVNRAWNIAARTFCRENLVKLFGECYVRDANPVALTARTWSPFGLRTNQLAEPLQKKHKGAVCEEADYLIERIACFTPFFVEQALHALPDLTILKELRFQPRKCGDLPKNPLYIAACQGNREVADLLIDAEAPIGTTASETSLMSVACDDSPVYKAFELGDAKFLKLLFENGASVKISSRNGDDKKPLIHRLLLLCRQSSVLFNLRCVIDAMRVYLREVGLKNIQNDSFLAHLLGESIYITGEKQIASLLRSYGVQPAFHPDQFEGKFPSIVQKLIAKGQKEQLVSLNKSGFLDFRAFCFEDGFSLADRAMEFGQFELGDFFESQGVQYKCINDVRSRLVVNISQAILNSIASYVDVGFYVIGHEGQKCKLQRLMQIVNRYTIPFATAELLFKVCDQLDNSICMDNKFEFLRIIRELKKRGASFDHPINGTTSRQILIQASKFNQSKRLAEALQEILKPDSLK